MVSTWRAYTDRNWIESLEWRGSVAVGAPNVSVGGVVWGTNLGGRRQYCRSWAVSRVCEREANRLRLGGSGTCRCRERFCALEIIASVMSTLRAGRAHILARLMATLKLAGMRAAFDERIADGLKRQHPVQRIIGELLMAEIADKRARSIKYQPTFPIYHPNSWKSYLCLPFISSGVHQERRPVRRHW